MKKPEELAVDWVLAQDGKVPGTDFVEAFLAGWAARETQLNETASITFIPAAPCKDDKP